MLEWKRHSLCGNMGKITVNLNIVVIGEVLTWESLVRKRGIIMNVLFKLKNIQAYKNR